MKKRLRRIFLYFSLTIGVVTAAPLVAIFFFQDNIIHHFIQEANKRINTPVEVKRVDVSLWKSFPNIGIVFHDVYVEDSYAPKAPLLTATSISIHIDPILFWRGQYSILELRINHGKVYVKVNKEGVNNYTILKNIKSDEGFINFDLRNIKLIETTISYLNKQHQEYQLSSKKLVASIAVSDWYDISAQGSLVADKVGVQSASMLTGKKIDVKMALRYNRENENLLIKPSKVTIRQSQFELQGKYETNSLHLLCKGKNTTIRTLLSLLPKKIDTYISKYKSDGDVYFNLAVKGRVDSDHEPALSVQFGLKNTTLFHTDYSSEIKHVNLKGNFFSPSITNLSGASLTLKGITGTLNDKHFEGEVYIKNFNDPYIKFNIKGDLDVSSMVNFYSINRLSDLTGSMHINIDFDGRIGLLKNKENINRISTKGALTLQNIGFVYKNHSHAKRVNGTLKFTHNDIKLDDIRGEFDNTDFRVSGVLKNIFAFLFLKDRSIGINANIKSNFVDMDQLFDTFIKKDTVYDHFNIPSNIHLNINYDIGSLHYKLFRPTALTGNLLIKNQTCALRDITFQSMGGDFSFNGVLDAQKDSIVDLMGDFKLNGIHIDSAFYVFNNFQQNFIRDKHLKGRIFADMDIEMALTKELIPLTKTLIANVHATIKGGELNKFTPLKKLDKYIPKAELDHLRFSDIKNNILIQHETVYIPRMELKSNATTIEVSGTHSFDQQIDYHLIVPLRLKERVDKDEAFGKVEESTIEKTKLFLRISGTTTNYDVTYEKEAVKRKIVNDIKKEVEELRDAFRQKGKQKKKTIEVQKEDYFDWDDTVYTHDK